MAGRLCIDYVKLTTCMLVAVLLLALAYAWANTESLYRGHGCYSRGSEDEHVDNLSDCSMDDTYDGLDQPDLAALIQRHHRRTMDTLRQSDADRREVERRAWEAKLITREKYIAKAVPQMRDQLAHALTVMAASPLVTAARRKELAAEAAIVAAAG